MQIEGAKRELGVSRGEIIDNLINIRVIVRRRTPIINAQLDASIDTRNGGDLQHMSLY